VVILGVSISSRGRDGGGRGTCRRHRYSVAVVGRVSALYVYDMGNMLSPPST
jgi:hypothetical protein